MFNNFRPIKILFVFVVTIFGIYLLLTQKEVGKQCNGFAANLREYKCGFGTYCMHENSSYPDASGTCKRSWIFLKK